MQRTNFEGLTTLQVEIDKKVENKINVLGYELIKIIRKELDEHNELKTKMKTIEYNITNIIRKEMMDIMVKEECKKLINK